MTRWLSTSIAGVATAVVATLAAPCVKAATAPVAAKPNPCVVVEKGFTAIPNDGTPGMFDVSVGYIVRANANVVDGSDVIVNFRDRAGKIIKSVVGESINRLPRGQQIPYGMKESDVGVTSIPREPSSIEVIITCERATTKILRLVTGKVGAEVAEGWDGPVAKFQVPLANSSDRIWRYGTEIPFILRDSSGRIVGGGVGQTYADLPPGADIAQDVSMESVLPGSGPYLVEFAVTPLVS